jgi:hypothetical protein
MINILYSTMNSQRVDYCNLVESEKTAGICGVG